MAFQISMYGQKPPKPKSQPKEEREYWLPPKHFVHLPVSYGVRAADGEWLCVYVDKRRATEIFEADPRAKQLVSDLDPLEGYDERPGVVVRGR